MDPKNISVVMSDLVHFISIRTWVWVIASRKPGIS